MTWQLSIGASYQGPGTRFRVWAPRADQVVVVLFDGNTLGDSFSLQAEGGGYFSGVGEGVEPGTRYMYRLDGGPPRPDPAARFQPLGPHGPSEVVDPCAFTWTDADWRGLPLEDLIIYELHVGTFTPEGSFEAAIAKLPYLRELGISAIELMPVADFPGRRNWGYDAVNLYAPEEAYGGPEGLRRLVDAAHCEGLAVLLDVVYNHFGPDGNYLRDFSEHYFTSHHPTPWGDALNFDDDDCEPVREYVVNNACYWAHEFHIDGLRLDATPQIIDESPTHILSELAATVRASLPAERHFVVIAENDLNEPLVVTPAAQGGWGLDGVWADDFHHQLRVTLTGLQDHYYANYRGLIDDLVTTIRQGWFYTGQHFASWDKLRGAPADTIWPPRLVYCIENHDQVGNRPLGERLEHMISPELFRAASALLLLLPVTPLIWQGQEWAASSPFQFFTDFEVELGRLVTAGRREEFAAFIAACGEDVPDPQDEATFLRSKLRWDEREHEPHAGVLRLYQDLLRLRREHPALRSRDRAACAVQPLGEKALILRRESGPASEALLALVNLGERFDVDLLAKPATQPPAGYAWDVLMASEDARYGGRGTTAMAHEACGWAQLELSGPGVVLLRACEPARVA
jgi:maltooligosyltrehalose trehalohydrolase